MRSFIAANAAAIASAAFMDKLEHNFIQFVAQYNKAYTTYEEYQFRFTNYKIADAEIEKFNSKNGSSVHAHNNMSDWTREEYSKLMGLKNAGSSNTKSSLRHVATNAPIANNIDWVAAGMVNPIKDQGQCGSCWAFSTTAADESAWAIKTGTLLSFSEQQLVDCSTAQGNMGCGGGWYYWAWDYLMTSGQMLESDYPYTSTAGVSGACQYNSAKTYGNTASPTDYVEVGATTADIKSALNVGPLSVAIAANTFYFQFYSGGVLTDAKCGTTIDHAVVAVGYGTDPTYGDYYLVRNSWGTGWGMSGYVKIGVADGLGICGINQDVAYPLFA